MTPMNTYLFRRSTPTGKPRDFHVEYRACSADSLPEAREKCDADNTWESVSMSGTVASYSHYITLPES